jgi:calcineurin-like phosphoesterase family protein
MTIFVTSDFHIDHANILKFAGRVFNTVKDMNNHIVTEWNGLVGEEDEVYFLGDLTLGRDPERALRFITSLSGDKYLLRGNHDHWMEKAQKKYPSEMLPFTYIEPIHELTVKGQLYVMSHYPMHSWNKKHYGSINLHGHVHSHTPNSGVNRIDVGWDAWETIPTLDQITNVAASYTPIVNEIKSTSNIVTSFPAVDALMNEGIPKNKFGIITGPSKEIF